MEKSLLLDKIGAIGEDRLAMAHLLDQAEQSHNRNIPVASDFLTPEQQRVAGDLLHLAGYSSDSYCFLGGYEGAERNLIYFLPDWMEAEMVDAGTEIYALRAKHRPEYQLSHRDFLGSLMSMGIVREKLGDFLVGETSTDIICLEGVKDFLLSSWESVGRAKITVEEIPLDHIHMPEVKTTEIHDTVSSVRLDAVLSSGLRMARGKAADLISTGKVQLNYKECTKTDKAVVAGDIISARGFGKMILKETGTITKKGRISITITRFL